MPRKRMGDAGNDGGMTPAAEEFLGQGELQLQALASIARSLALIESVTSFWDEVLTGIVENDLPITPETIKQYACKEFAEMKAEAEAAAREGANGGDGGEENGED